MANDVEKQAIRRIMKDVSSPCVVELGARTGEDEPWIRGCCRDDPHYIMVEPDMWNAQKILDDPRGLDQNRKLILGAITAGNGDSVGFFPSTRPDGVSRTSGSIRRPTGHYQRYPDVFFDAETRVPCWTLDSIFKKDWLTKIDLLWVDIQGAEGDMILGGRKSLERTRYLFMEVEREEMYHGQALRDDLIAMLSNWKLIEDFGENVLLENTCPVEGRI